MRSQMKWLEGGCTWTRGLILVTKVKNIVWSQWHSAVSMREACQSRANRPQGTRVASLVCSHLESIPFCLDFSLFARDYNTRLLHAPSWHLSRPLGRTSEVTGSLLDSQVKFPFSSTKEIHNAPRIIQQLEAAAGLGCRTQVIALGHLPQDLAGTRCLGPRTGS
jgi:hypothetical protein